MPLLLLHLQLKDNSQFEESEGGVEVVSQYECGAPLSVTELLMTDLKPVDLDFEDIFTVKGTKRVSAKACKYAKKIYF
jgi:hypothetical protein